MLISQVEPLVTRFWKVLSIKIEIARLKTNRVVSFIQHLSNLIILPQFDYSFYRDI